jgi:hypothetical protein
MHHGYRPTESKYKGGAEDMYVTYDLEQKTGNGQVQQYPKVKRVYIAGDVKDWKVGDVKKRTGRKVHGVAIEYEQSRESYRRRGFTAHRDGTKYSTRSASVPGTSQRFRKVVEIPKDAHNVHFYKSAGKLPAKYRSAVQDVK